MKKTKWKFLSTMLAVLMICGVVSPVAVLAVDVLVPDMPIGTQAPVLTISGSTISWSTPASPYEFVITADGNDKVTLGPYASYYDLNDFNLSGSRNYTITVRANFLLGGGPAMTSSTSNAVTFTPAATSQPLPTPSIRLVAGYYIEISAAWGAIPNLIRDGAQFVIYADNYSVATISASTTSYDLTQLGLAQGNHNINVSIISDSTYWLDSPRSNTVNFNAANPAQQQLPTPTLSVYGANISIYMPQENMPYYVYNYLQYRVYIDGTAQSRMVSGDFSLDYFSAYPGNHQVLVVATSADDGWRDSRRSNTVNAISAGAARIGNASLSASSVNAGDLVTITITGIAYADRLEISRREGNTKTVVQTFTNPAATITHQLAINSTNINALVVNVYGQYGTDERTLPITVQSLPNLLGNPIALDNGIGVLLEWSVVPGNTYGYRVYRASSATSEGTLIAASPISMNSAYSETRVITFDANARPGYAYWYYVREVRQLYPEVLGPASARARVDIPSVGAQAANVNRNFIVMIINNPRMNTNNSWSEIDLGVGTAPIIRDDRTMVPIRAIVESMGGTIAFDPSDSRLDFWLYSSHVQMWLGSDTANLNGQTRQMDVAPYLLNDRALIPVRYVAEFLGTYIGWIDTKSIVVIVY